MQQLQIFSTDYTGVIVGMAGLSIIALLSCWDEIPERYLYLPLALVIVFVSIYALYMNFLQPAQVHLLSCHNESMVI